MSNIHPHVLSNLLPLHEIEDYQVPADNQTVILQLKNVILSTQNIESLNNIKLYLKACQRQKNNESQELLDHVISVANSHLYNLQNLQISFSGKDVADVDFSSLYQVEELNLANCYNLTPQQFNSIPNKGNITKLDLSHIDVTNFDFSQFHNLDELILTNAKNLTAEQFNSIPEKEDITQLDISYCDVENFNFSTLSNLKKLLLIHVENLTKRQFKTIPNKASIKKISPDHFNSTLVNPSLKKQF
jgi:hypothetical protein